MLIPPSWVESFALTAMAILVLGAVGNRLTEGTIFLVESSNLLLLAIVAMLLAIWARLAGGSPRFRSTRSGVPAATSVSSNTDHEISWPSGWLRRCRSQPSGGVPCLVC